MKLFSIGCVKIILFQLLIGMSSAQANLLEATFIGLDRIITVQGDGVRTLRIHDSYGPKESPYFGLWAISRWIGFNGVRDSLNKSHWLKTPTHEEISRAKADREGFEHLDLPAYPLPNYDEEFEIALTTDSLDGFEYLILLRDETYSISLIHLKNFVGSHLERFKNLLKHKELEKRGLDKLGRFQDGNYLQICDQITGLTNVLDLFEYENISESEREEIREFELEHTRKREKIRSGKIPKTMLLSRYTNVSLNHPLIVVHPNWAKHDFQETFDLLIQKFKEANLPVAYLIDGTDDPEDENDFEPGVFTLKDRNPTVALYSKAGEHSLEIPSEDVTIIGAYWGECHRQAIVNTIDSHFAKTQSPLSIHLPLEAIVKGGDDDIVRSKKEHLMDYAVDFERVDLLKAFSTPTRSGKSRERFIIKMLFDNTLGGFLTPEGLSHPRFRTQYRFSFIQSGITRIHLGQGPRQVNFKFWRQSDFINHVIPALVKSHQKLQPSQMEIADPESDSEEKELDLMDIFTRPDTD